MYSGSDTQFQFCRYDRELLGRWPTISLIVPTIKFITKLAIYINFSIKFEKS